MQDVQQGIRTMKYEEFLRFQLVMQARRKSNKQLQIGSKKEFDVQKVWDLCNKLPFTLTNDQKKAIEDILNDEKSSGNEDVEKLRAYYKYVNPKDKIMVNDNAEIDYYNEAVRLAKKLGKPVVYGYTKGENAEFYGLEPREYDLDTNNQFRKKYQAKSIRVAYPNDSLKESFNKVNITTQEEEINFIKNMLLLIIIQQ